jgi:molecular chaperone GrpE
MNQTKRTEDLEAEEASETAFEQGAAPTDAEADRAGATTPAAGEPEAPREPSPRELELETELAATKERLLRALADTENLRRRSAREVEEAHKYAITGFARELLEVADNLSRALVSIPPRAREEIDFVRSLADGVAITEKALLASFERHQIAKVVPELGSRFDHNRHQAMLEIESSEHPPGTIAQVMQPGYVIADRLLRPALVGVAKAPPAEPAGDGDGQPIPIRSGQRFDTTA